jgi:hypothetical protein
MPLKVIGAGFGRTGTNSTYTALKQLGFPCYHMFDVLENPANKTHLQFWNTVANSPVGTQHQWDQVLVNYTAVVDNPTTCVWRELYAQNPDAKILLTLHPKGAEAWYQSTYETIYFTQRLWQFKVLRLLTPFGRKMGNMTEKLIWKGFMKDCMRSKESAIQHYNNYIEEVRSEVPEEKLLIYSVDQGWKPLCDFLGVPIPDAPFPRVNDREQMKKKVAQMTQGAYVMLALATGVAVGLATLAWFLLT